MTETSSEDPTLKPSLIHGFLLVSILLNSSFFGVVSQQFYSYWTSGFKDPKHVKIFVVTQFSVISFQSIILWQEAWSVFIVHRNDGPLLDLKAYTWRAPTSSLCECVLVLFANAFLIIRIYTLTRSRLQTGLIMVLSGTAFILGLVTSTTSWIQVSRPSFGGSFSASERALAATWLGLQAISECLITVFLARALLRSRTGLQKSNTVVGYLVRSVIQIGFFASVWAIGGLVTWFFLPKLSLYTVFNNSAGSMYTHVIYDTLLSRIRLREKMAETVITMTDVSPSTQPWRWTKRETLEGHVDATEIPELLDSTASVVTTESLSLTTTCVWVHGKPSGDHGSKTDTGHVEQADTRASHEFPLPAS